METSRSNNSILIWIALMLLLGVISLFAMPGLIKQAVIVQDRWSHGLTKHANDITFSYHDVIKCLDNKGPILTIKEGKSKYFQFCQLDDKHFGVRILKDVDGRRLKFREITAYWRQDMSSKLDIIKFANNNKLAIVNPLP